MYTNIYCILKFFGSVSENLFRRYTLELDFFLMASFMRTVVDLYCKFGYVMKTEKGRVRDLDKVCCLNLFLQILWELLEYARHGFPIKHLPPFHRLQY